MYNTFKYKINILDYQQIPEVKYIIRKLSSIPMEERKRYVIENGYADRLRDLYWEKVYGSLEDFHIAQEIYEVVMHKDNKNKNRNEILNDLKEECIKRGREDLFKKIDNICPNGDIVVNYTLMNLIGDL